MKIILTATLIGLLLTAQTMAQSVNQTVGGTEDKNTTILFSGLSGELLQNVKANVELYRLQDSNEAISRARRAQLSKRIVDQIKEALQPFGYYNASVTLKAPTLEGSSQIRDFHVEPGDPVIVRKLDLSIVGEAGSDELFDQWLKYFPLQPGMILRQPDYELAKSALLSLANERGYFDAQLVTSSISIDKERLNASVLINFDSGVRYRYGPASLSWSSTNAAEMINEKLLRGFIKMSPEAPFAEIDLLETQSELVETGFFSSVSVRPDVDSKQDGIIPIVISLQVKKRILYALSIGAGTDTGPRASLGYENRRVNAKGHKFIASIAASMNQQNAVLNYKVPLVSSPSDSINFSAALIDENSTSVQRQTSSISVDIANVFDGWQWGYGASYRDETFLQDGKDISSQLLMPRLSWQKLSADDLNNPSRGWSASASLRGAHDSMGSDVSFIQAITNVKFLRPMGNGRFISRLDLAGTSINNPKQLPLSLRFFAGGDSSIRGYKFESIGVENDSEVSGARHLVVGSVEYELPIINDFGIAAFFDIGDAFNDKLDFKRGAGLGLRWRLPFGALRLDLASALDLEGQPMRVHFTFGTDL